MDINKALDNIKNKNNFYLRNIEDENSKNKWVTILNKNPNKAIEEYHKILCKNNPENEGFCNLLDLFKILGSLEQLNKQNEVMKSIEEKYEKKGEKTKNDLQIKYEKEKKAVEEELNNQISEIQEKNNEIQLQSETKTTELKNENETLKQQQQTANNDLIKINNAVEELLGYINNIPVTNDNRLILGEAKKKVENTWNAPPREFDNKEEVLNNIRNKQSNKL
jgi:hypothetical protein